MSLGRLVRSERYKQIVYHSIPFTTQLPGVAFNGVRRASIQKPCMNRQKGKLKHGMNQTVAPAMERARLR